jgi:hypothetical protein
MWQRELCRCDEVKDFEMSIFHCHHRIRRERQKGQNQRCKNRRKMLE